MKAATMVGLVTILLGMVCLVLDLTDPFNFWRILIFYNPTSVMSIGVAALLFYIPPLFCFDAFSLQRFADIEVSKTAHRLPRSFPSCAGLGGHDSSRRDLRLHRLPDLRADSFPAHQHGSSPGLFVASGFSAAAPPFVSLRIASVQSVKTPPCISCM